MGIVDRDFGVIIKELECVKEKDVYVSRLLPVKRKPF